MKGLRLLQSAAAATVFCSTAVLAEVDPIIIKGSKFFYKTNGTEFFMKGVAYQEDYAGNGTAGSNTYIDPLADPEKCRRDVPLLRDLSTNTIRTYAIDPTKDHDECMQLLEDAGIYVISDLSEPNLSIVRDSPVWNSELYDRYIAVVDVLSKYSNVIGFFAGNEVSNAANNTAASPFVKAAVRDIKAYIRQRNYRPMGVGYATSDDEQIRDNIADFFNCGPQEEAIDFYGYNVYSWCGDSNYQESGFKDRTEDFATYSVPVFFAEYGCNQPSPREFSEVGTLYGDEMSPVWSGGIVYMYHQEANNYGLVSIDDSSASLLPDYTALSTQLASVTPSSATADDYTPTNTQARECPPTGNFWNASSDLPPTPNEELCSCALRSMTCVARAGISGESISELFSTVCGLDNSACDGIAADGSTGTYGALSMCDPTVQLSWAFNSYYFHQDSSNRQDACDFDGNAQTQNPTTPEGNCRSLLQQVGDAGTGTVTSMPTATGGGSRGSGAGAGTGSTSTSTKTGAASAVLIPEFSTGLLGMGAYLIVSALVGAGMILL
ncbi:MAG: 1,3-beta-glucanosyltransferase gas1 [Caeruleum heppii]|nr:MAG: 1,3-beta-glucanosyltransferase gas1 [Caeruleum heppii]